MAAKGFTFRHSSVHGCLLDYRRPFSVNTKCIHTALGLNLNVFAIFCQPKSLQHTRIYSGVLGFSKCNKNEFINI